LGNLETQGRYWGRQYEPYTDPLGVYQTSGDAEGILTMTAT